MFEWKDVYETGVKEIDEQHKTIFAFMSDFSEKMDKGCSEIDIIGALNFLEAYIDMHFAFEEGCMLGAKCPVADKNKEEHCGFRKLFNRYKIRFQEEGHSEDLTREMFHVMAKWLMMHIGGVDLHLKQALEK